VLLFSRPAPIPHQNCVCVTARFHSVYQVQKLRDFSSTVSAQSFSEAFTRSKVLQIYFLFQKLVWC